MSRPLPKHSPEILAPAGDLVSLEAALRAGADAVYFGLDEGFNARARAENFPVERLPETVARVHRAGAKVYLTLNTLVFEPELPAVEALVVAAARAGVDALIVQDPAVALLAREVCPELHVHASTQMTISSPEGARFAEALGVTRVVVPRELSVKEIRRFVEGTSLETEVFIHGALCVAWSGQCLTSEAWGQRSANRGQCAQSCRMPYTAVLDGQDRDLEDVRYLLSPKDLAGMRAVPELVDIGVHGLKIEGRQKGPAYVATAVRGYAALRNACLNESPRELIEEQAREALQRMTSTYTRGFSDGFLAGSDHQTLVEGRFPKHRGHYLGRVVSVARHDVFVEDDPEGRPWTGGLLLEERSEPRGTVSAPLEGFGNTAEAAAGPAARPLAPARGMGVVFDAGEPEDKHEPGGPLFDVERIKNGYRLRFGNPGPDLSKVRPGQRAWITSDPSVQREGVDGAEPTGRINVSVTVTGAAGSRLTVRVEAGPHAASVESGSLLATSSGKGLDDDLLRGKLLAFGGTPFQVDSLTSEGLASHLHLPVSELKRMRRDLVADLLPQVERGVPRTVRASALPAVRKALESQRTPLTDAAQLIPLCRTPEQLEAVIAARLSEVELDWMEWVGLGTAVARARSAGLKVTIATLRVQKPGEEGFDQRLERLRPDGILVRHWGAMVHANELPESSRPELHGDFSLNVTNSITAEYLLAQGLTTITASHDLDERQLRALLAKTSPDRVTVVAHHRIPTFHTEHCVFSHLLSEGRDHRTCGRPCEKHALDVRDHQGRAHPIIVDAGCRNTVFNGEVQSSAFLVPDLLRLGVRRFRVEFVRETHEEASRALACYADLLAERTSPNDVLRLLSVKAQQGVSSGTMELIV